jgi:Spy/CpxP family protein refolding chaperone
MLRAVMILGALLTYAPPLAAQGHEHPAQPKDSVASAEHAGRMQHMMQMMRGGTAEGAAMGGGMPDTPEAMALDLPLRLRTSLGLSPDQIDRLDETRGRAEAARAERLRQAEAAERAAADALHRAPPDLAAYEAGLREAAAHRVEARLAMARAALEAREILDPAQRARLQAAMEMMHEMMGHR